MRAYRVTEVNRNHVAKAYSDHGGTYWIALYRYNATTKGYDIVASARADNAKGIDAKVQELTAQL